MDKQPLAVLLSNALGKFPQVLTTYRPGVRLRLDQVPIAARIDYLAINAPIAGVAGVTHNLVPTRFETFQDKLFKHVGVYLAKITKGTGRSVVSAKVPELAQ
jgi:hypothetical protein